MAASPNGCSVSIPAFLLSLLRVVGGKLFLDAMLFIGSPNQPLPEFDVFVDRATTQEPSM
jgi:hypothetical protein